MGQHDFDTRIINNGFSIKSTSTGVRLSVEILIDELKPVVHEINQFEKRDESILMVFFQEFRTMGMVTQDTKTPISQNSFLLQVERF